MIKAFLGVVVVLLAAAGAANGPGRSWADSRRLSPRTSSVSIPLTAEGTDSTPGVFALPQLGSVSFRCGRNLSVQPFFSMASAVASEEVTIRAGTMTRRNFKERAVGRTHGRPVFEEEFSPAEELALPSGHYGIVNFTVHQGDEARLIEATLTAEFVAGTFRVPGVREPLAACYVKRWSVRMIVS